MTLPLPDYDDLDGMALAELVRRREVSARELAEAAIARIEARNPPINAVVRTLYETGRAQAEGSNLSGPFAGVPFLLKDLLLDLAGTPTTSGSRLLADYVPGEDSTLVERYRAAGLLFLGKTNTPELGLLAHTAPRLFGPCRNPWDLTRTPGGSSGGAAAAVAARMVPLAAGGDGGGSIRIPASACGLFGLKPTRARNPLGPSFTEGWNGLVVQHVLTRSVRDSAAILDAAHGAAPGDPYVAPAPEAPFLEAASRPGEARGLRIAFHAGSLFGREIHPDCVAAVEDAARLLSELGHTLEDAKPEIDRDELIHAYFILVCANTAATLALAAERLGTPLRRRHLELTTWFLHRLGQRLRAVELEQAIHSIHRAGRQLAQFHRRFDLFLTSTLAAPPKRIGEQELTWRERLAARLVSRVPIRRLLDAALRELGTNALEATPNTQLFNQTGQPAMNVPLCWNQDGLPIGVQLAARFGDESTLLRVAAQLEEARPWARRKPPLVA